MIYSTILNKHNCFVSRKAILIKHARTTIMKHYSNTRLSRKDTVSLICLICHNCKHDLWSLHAVLDGYIFLPVIIQSDG